MGLASRTLGADVSCGGNPYQVFVPLPVGVSEERATNLVFDLGDEEMMRDIRGSRASFTLDEHGFTIMFDGHFASLLFRNGNYQLLDP